MLLHKRKLLRPSIVLCVSGGVDSAVAAALVHQCVRTTRDVHALSTLWYRRDSNLSASTLPPPPTAMTSIAPLSVDALTSAIVNGLPLHQVLLPSVGRATTDLDYPDEPILFRSVFMNNWRSDEHEDGRLQVAGAMRAHSSGVCHNATQDAADATETIVVLNRLRAESLTPSSSQRQPPLSLSLLDFSEQYHHHCVTALLDAYVNGDTCNVDVLCNTRIKFGTLLAHCKRFVSPTCLLVTGHYVRTIQRGQVFPTHASAEGLPTSRRHDTLAPKLLAKPLSWAFGTDGNNDQSQFLAELDPTTQLAHGLFPIGALFRTKRDVRQVARRIGLHHLAEKKTSTGLCFVGSGNATSCRKQASGRFPMWIHGMLEEEGRLPSTRAAGKVRRMRWVVLSGAEGNMKEGGSGECDVDAVCVDITRTVAGLHLDAREPLVLVDGVGVQPPAYAFTVGERIQVRLTSGSVVPFYVARKHMVASATSAGTEGGLPPPSIAVVVLCTTHAHPLLFQRSVCLRDVQWYGDIPPTAALYVAFRHLEPLRRCQVLPSQAVAGTSSGLPDGSTAEVRLMDGEPSVRWVPPGQLAAFYVHVGSANTSSGAGRDSNDATTAVVGCGWVVSG